MESGGEVGTLWSAGIHCLRVTRHQAHDSKHSQHTHTLAWPHSHTSPLRVSLQITIMTLYSVKCHVDHPTAQQRRDENMSEVT